MASYSTERKESVLKKLLPPHNLSVSVLAKQEGITEATLYNWRKQAKKEGTPVPGNQPNISENLYHRLRLYEVFNLPLDRRSICNQISDRHKLHTAFRCWRVIA